MKCRPAEVGRVSYDGAAVGLALEDHRKGGRAVWMLELVSVDGLVSNRRSDKGAQEQGG